MQKFVIFVTVLQNDNSNPWNIRAAKNNLYNAKYISLKVIYLVFAQDKDSRAVVDVTDFFVVWISSAFQLLQS